MPQSDMSVPNFERLASELATHFLATDGLDDGWFERNERRIAEQLRLVWNARGAADVAKIEFEIPNVWASPEPAGPLTRALRSLDR